MSLQHCHRSGHKISVVLSLFKLHSHPMHCIALRYRVAMCAATL